MGEFIYFTEEQKERANAVPIANILRREREEVIRSGNEWRWKRHQSVTFRGSSWYRHSQQVGSHAIDFMQEFFGMTYPEAVTYLLDGETGEVMQGVSNRQTDRINQKVGKKKHMEKREEKEQKELKPPEKNPTMKRVYAYLLQSAISAGRFYHTLQKQEHFMNPQSIIISCLPDWTRKGRFAIFILRGPVRMAGAFD